MITSVESKNNWHQLANSVIGGKQIEFDDALNILQAPDSELLRILAAAYEIRHHHFINDVQLYFLMNAKSGLCPEDCTYCSQSKDATSDIPKYNILSREKLLDGARIAAERDSKTYCIVISAPRSERTRNGSRHDDRSRDQKEIRSQNLRLPRFAKSRPSSAVKGMWCRPRKPQREHQLDALRRNLLHSFL